MEKTLLKPIVVPFFYWLPVEYCSGRAEHGKLTEMMKAIAKMTGVRNDIGAANDGSEEMMKKREELLGGV